MAMNQSKWGKGTLLQYSKDSGVTYTSIPQVISDITLPSPEAEDMDVTHHESPGRRREALDGFIPIAKLPFTISWLPSSAIHQALLADYIADPPVLRDFKIIWTDDKSNYATFQGYISMFEPSGPLTSQNKASCSIKLAGDVTHSAL